MAARDRSARRSPASHRPPTHSPARGLWPTGPVPIPTGTVELVRDLDDPDGITVLHASMEMGEAGARPDTGPRRLQRA